MDWKWNCTTWPQFPGVWEWEDNPLHYTPPLVHHMDCSIIRRATKPSMRGLLPLYTLSLLHFFFPGLMWFSLSVTFPSPIHLLIFPTHSLPHSFVSPLSVTVLLLTCCSFFAHINFIYEISSTISLGKYKLDIYSTLRRLICIA